MGAALSLHKHPEDDAPPATRRRPIINSGEADQLVPPQLEIGDDAAHRSGASSAAGTAGYDLQGLARSVAATSPR